MKIVQILKATVPVVIGVIAAGLIMNALRDTDFINRAINGFDG